MYDVCGLYIWKTLVYRMAIDTRSILLKIILYWYISYYWYCQQYGLLKIIYFQRGKSL